MTNRAIRDLAAFFVLLFAILAIRQIYVQVIEAPKIAARPNNPRHALLDVGRGRILATDGTVLARSSGNHRIYPLGEQLAQVVGYASPRYGTSGIEGAFDQALSPPGSAGDPAEQFDEIVATRRRRGDDDRTAGTDAALPAALALSARRGRRDRSAHRRGVGTGQRPQL
jgi:hypothetical protein